MMHKLLAYVKVYKGNRKCRSPIHMVLDDSLQKVKQDWENPLQSSVAHLFFLKKELDLHAVIK